MENAKIIDVLINHAYTCGYHQREVWDLTNKNWNASLRLFPILNRRDRSKIVESVSRFIVAQNQSRAQGYRAGANPDSEHKPNAR